MGTANWANKTIWTGDCLEVMRGMNSESVDLIYLDPPFNSETDYAAPIGSKAAGAAFKDTWTLTDVDVEWINLIEAKHPSLHRVLLAATSKSDKSYLAYMAPRLVELRRILKRTGSVYLHCDATMGHYLKLTMDTIFGKRNFRSEIHWHYYNKMHDYRKRLFASATDTIFFYVKDAESQFTFRQLKEKRDKPTRQLVRKKIDGRMVNARDVDGKLMYRLAVDKGIDNVWRIPTVVPRSKDWTGFKTQKPRPLLRRIIESSSEPGDMVFDPFCGCATTLVVADELGRSWGGGDISPKAAELVVQRVRELGEDLYRHIIHRTDIPRRTDLGKLPPYNCAANRRRLYGEQGGNCVGCGTHFEARHLEVDHIIARKRGGTDHLENLQLLCGSCNRIKGDRGMEYLKAKLQL